MIGFFFLTVIQWLNKQINETQLQQHRTGTFEMPGATSNFRPSGSALVYKVILHSTFFVTVNVPCSVKRWFVVSSKSITLCQPAQADIRKKISH